MITRSKKGNLLSMFDASEFDTIIHGCNCQAKMASGIARQIADAYPEVEEVDTLIHSLNGERMYGYNQYITLDDGKIVVNAYTQKTPGVWQRVDGIRQCMENLIADHRNGKMNFGKIGIPEIGCGIAGNDWDYVYPIIHNITKELEITHVEYDG